ncbi:lipoprotein, partial [Staphylococcus argensis]
MKKLIIVSIIILMLSGCSSIDHRKRES